MATLTRKCLALAFLSIYLLNLGCSSVREVPVKDALSPGSKVYSAILLSGEVVEFDEHGGIVNAYRGTIDGKSPLGKDISIKLDDVKTVRMDKTDTTKTVVWTVVVLGAVVAVAAYFWSLAWSGYSFP